MAKRCGRRLKLYFQLLHRLRLRGFHKILHARRTDRRVPLSGYQSKVRRCQQRNRLGRKVHANRWRGFYVQHHPFVGNGHEHAPNDVNTSEGFAIWKVAKQAY